MNSPETQRSFIGSGHPQRLWPKSSLNDLVFWHRSSWETCLHSQISHHLSPQNHTHVPLCQRAQPPLLLCMRKDLQLGLQRDSELRHRNSSTAAPSPRPQKFRVHLLTDLPKGNGGLSSQPRCMLKTIRQIVLSEEAAKGEAPNLIRIVDTSLNMC